MFTFKFSYVNIVHFKTFTKVVTMKKTVLLSLLTLTLYAKTSLEVAQKSFERVSNYKSSLSTTTMILENASGDKNIRKIEIKKLEGKDGDKSLLTFLYPNDLKGTKLLSYEVIAGDDKQWLYLPAIKRVKRISSRNKSGSFMASEFSYEDIASQNYKNYSYNDLAQEVVVDGKNYFKITRFPKDKNSGYSKQILWIDTTNYLAHFGEYYDKHKRLLKKIEFLDYVKLDGIYRVHKMVMNNTQNKKRSTLVWESDKIGMKLSKKEFSKRALR